MPEFYRKRGVVGRIRGREKNHKKVHAHFVERVRRLGGGGWCGCLFLLVGGIGGGHRVLQIDGRCISHVERTGPRSDCVSLCHRAIILISFAIFNTTNSSDYSVFSDL